MKSVRTGVSAPTRMGLVQVAVTDRGLAAVGFDGQLEKFSQILRRMGRIQIEQDDDHTSRYTHQIEAYLCGELKDFDFEIDWSVMTPFQARVLQATAAIPYGQVSTYAQIAEQLGKPHAARAVGRAEATNPMPLVIPCHRVLGTDGKLHGYGGPGGLETKSWLLEMEAGAFGGYGPGHPSASSRQPYGRHPGEKLG